MTHEKLAKWLCLEAGLHPMLSPPFERVMRGYTSDEILEAIVSLFLNEDPPTPKNLSRHLFEVSSGNAID